MKDLLIHRFFYFSPTKSSGNHVQLNLMFDILPTTFYDEISRRHLEEDKWSEKELANFCNQICCGLQVIPQYLPPTHISVPQFYIFQYLHDLAIIHRDLKPRNLLLSPETGLVQICDLGSACHVNSGSPLTAYICSRSVVECALNA